MPSSSSSMFSWLFDWGWSFGLLPAVEGPLPLALCSLLDLADTCIGIRKLVFLFLPLFSGADCSWPRENKLLQKDCRLPFKPMRWFFKYDLALFLTLFSLKFCLILSNVSSCAFLISSRKASVSLSLELSLSSSSWSSWSFSLLLSLSMSWSDWLSWSYS